MPAAKLTHQEWAEVRAASEAGMDDVELSKEFRVPRAAIRQRRKREKWLTPKALMEMSMVQEAKDKAKRMNNGSVTNVTDETPTPSALATVGAKLSKLREETPLLIAEKVVELITQGLKVLPVPKDWKTMSLATNILNSQLHPKGSGGGGVNIAIGGMNWGGSAPSAPKPVIVVS